MPDFLDRLLAQHPIANPTGAVDLPLTTRELVQQFLGDCAARNLQSDTITFYKLQLSYLVDAAATDYRVHS